MRRTLTCVNGHQWYSQDDSEKFCPYCGGAVSGQRRHIEVSEVRKPTSAPAKSSAQMPPRAPAPRPAQPRATIQPAPAEPVAAPIPPLVPPAVRPGHPAPTQPAVSVAPPSTDIQFAKLELPPSLPMSIFTSTERWQAERVGAMAIYCSDGRWGDACDEFCHRSLLIPHYDRFAVPGGPAWITQICEQSDLGRAAREQLEFLVRAHELDRIVLITHFGCAFYAERLKQDEQHCLPAQFEDVKKAAAALRGWFKEIKVEGYLAMRNAAVISFHRLEV